MVGVESSKKIGQQKNLPQKLVDLESINSFQINRFKSRNTIKSRHNTPTIKNWLIFLVDILHTSKSPRQIQIKYPKRGANVNTNVFFFKLV